MRVITKNFVAGGTIPENSLVKPHTTAGQVVVATAATDLIIGICDQPGGATTGQRVDITMAGMADVKAAGTIAAGGPVTSNGSGLGVAAAPSAGVNNRVAGFAVTAAVTGDIIPVLLAPHTMQGA